LIHCSLHQQYPETKVLDSHQLSEWMAYYTIEPFGQYPEFLRAGIIAATVANVHQGKKGRTFTAEDFMPKEPGILKPKKQTTGEMKAAIRQIASWAKKEGLTKKKKKEK